MYTVQKSHVKGRMFLIKVNEATSDFHGMDGATKGHSSPIL